MNKNCIKHKINNDIMNEIIRSFNISLNILNDDCIWTSNCSLWQELVDKNISENVQCRVVFQAIKRNHDWL